ncbi:MAG: hypothetical protein V1889_01625 [archaeon]
MKDIIEEAREEGRFRAEILGVVRDIEYAIKVYDGRSRPSCPYIEKMIERYAALIIKNKRFEHLEKYGFALEIIATRGELSEIDKWGLKAAELELLKYSHPEEI